MDSQEYLVSPHSHAGTESSMMATATSVLPAEVMLKIWTLILPEPCFVTTQWTPEVERWYWETKNTTFEQEAHNPDDIEFESTDDRLCRYHRTDQKVPIVLQLCRASRYEFLHQPGQQRAHPTYQLYDMGLGESIYIDPIEDVLILDSSFPVMSEDLKNLNNIAIRIHVKPDAIDYTLPAAPGYANQLYHCGSPLYQTVHLQWILLSKIKQIFLVFPDLIDDALGEQATADTGTPSHIFTLYRAATIQLCRQVIELEAEGKAKKPFPEIVCVSWNNMLRESGRAAKLSRPRLKVYEGQICIGRRP